MVQSATPGHLDRKGEVVVVGSSLASGSCIAKLRELGHTGPILAIDQDPLAPYDRPQLSKKFLTEAIDLEVPRWWSGDCELVCASAVALDPLRHTVQVEYGTGETRSISGDAIVIATGARARKLENEPDGVLHLRSAYDAMHLRELIDSGVTRATIIGCGSLGTEIASSLRTRGVAVSIVDSAELPLLRLVGAQMGMHVVEWMREWNVVTYLNSNVKSIQRTVDEWTVELVSGEEITSDIVVSTVGAIPNVEMLEGSGLAVSDGLHCDMSGAALDCKGSIVPGIYVAGDVALTKQMDGAFRRDESWTSAQTQGAHVAETLLFGDSAENEPSPPYFWTEQFGRKVQILGRVNQAGSLSCVRSAPNGSGGLYRFDDGGNQLAWIAVNSPADFAKATLQGLASVVSR